MKKVINLLILLTFASCAEKKNDEYSEIHISIPPLKTQSNKLNTSRVVSHSSTQELDVGILANGNGVEPFPMPPPALVSDFDCLMVNVIGPGIGEVPDPSRTEIHDINAIQTKLLSEKPIDFQTYVGIPSNIVQNVPGQAFNFTLNVPKGNNRIIQLIGFKNSIIKDANNVLKPSICPSSIVNDGVMAKVAVAPYMISHTVITSLTGSISVSLNNDYKNFLNDTGISPNFKTPNPLFRVVSQDIPIRAHRMNGSTPLTYCSAVSAAVTIPNASFMLNYKLQLTPTLPASANIKSIATVTGIQIESNYPSTASPVVSPSQLPSVFSACTMSSTAAGKDECSFSVTYPTSTGIGLVPSAFRVNYEIPSGLNDGRIVQNLSTRVVVSAVDITNGFQEELPCY